MTENPGGPPHQAPDAPNQPPAWGQQAGQQPNQQPGQQSPYAPYPPAAPTIGIYARPVPPVHPLAVTSLVLGCISIMSLLLAVAVGITIVGVLCAPFAIWLGRRAQREIKQQPETYSGDGIALAGFITGIVGCVLGVLAVLVIAAVAVFIIWIFAEASDASTTMDTMNALRMMR